jgi:RNA polymerase sigma factor (sigma-70 family)
MTFPSDAHPLLTAALKHESLLRKVLWRYTRNRADVDEILQETYIRLMHRSVEGIHNVRGYAMRTAFNVAVELVRHRNVIPLELVADIDILEGLTDDALIEEVIQQHQELERLVRAVKQLPLQMQQAFVLAKVYGFSHQQIKARTRMSQRVLERRLTDAVRLVAAILGSDPRGYGIRPYLHADRMGFRHDT